jgi:hypothetical protein
MTDPDDRWVAAMRAERFEEAWAISQQRLRALDPAKRDDPSLPYHLRWVWDGRAFDGREVLVRCYHGLGDTIQFARYLPMLAERSASVTLEVHPRLTPLLKSVRGVRSIVAFDPGHPLPPSECDLEITELGFALRQHPASAPQPYLHGPRAALPERMIGLCYSAGDWDPERSVPAELWRGLCGQHRVLSLVAEPTTLPVLNPGGCPFDIEATAALVNSCELVITVDTMIAHLAGALGRPTLLLLKTAPDWRWTPGAERTSWYPTMRLFTQKTVGEWSGVVSAVEQALTRRTDDPGEGECNDEPTGHPAGAGVLG